MPVLLLLLAPPALCFADLIALVTVYDAVIATIGTLIVDGGLPDTSAFDKHTFYTVVTITAFGATFARLLYQRALSIAPLSLTVPYLAFTPAFVVLISPLFLVGEAASPMGMLGEYTAAAAAAAAVQAQLAGKVFGLQVTCECKTYTRLGFRPGLVAYSLLQA
jgi:uncharacterized membrane protein